MGETRAGAALRYWDDLKVGEVFEAGPYAVTREEIIEFGRKFDPQPFHLDEKAAELSPFKGLVASGWHTASITHRMVVEGALNTLASQGSPGVDQLRWLLPVRPGDVLTARVEITELTASETKPRGTAHLRYEVRNQKGELVMTQQARGLIARRRT